MSRSFFNHSIQDLEAEFERRQTDHVFLQALAEELDHRSTERAGRLKSRVFEQLRTETAPSQPSNQPPPPDTSASSKTASAPMPEPPSPMPPVTNRPEDILAAWTALEVLSPPVFRRPEDLAGGERRNVSALDGTRLPWSGGGESSRPQMRLYYQIVLGSIEMEPAVQRLLSRYSDQRGERPAARGEAILALVIVDQRGRLAAEPAVALASFGWGLSQSLRGNLVGLADWRTAEKALVQGLTERLKAPAETDMPLDRTTLQTAFDWLQTQLGLPADLVRPPRFAIKTYQYYRNPDPPDTLLLNSFFIGDLSLARDLFTSGKAPTNLRRYLGAQAPTRRRDLLNERAALETAIAPAAIPAARWPGAGRHPLVLLQQAAVNLAMQELRTEGIFAINGPPGTGKTTLLRDLVASVVTARAEVMVSFSDPATAFSDSGERLKFSQSSLYLYRLDPRLKGFEMLVASSNNKAVENVSAELPGLKAIAEDVGSLRYFKTLSDALYPDTPTWGLIAAVLGNAGNRAKFKQTFWWDQDAGLSTYLAEAAGTPQQIEETDPQTGRIRQRPPRIVSVERPPSGPAEALTRWAQARSAFQTTLGRSRAALGELEKIRVAGEKQSLFENEKQAADQAADLSRAREVEAAQALQAADAVEVEARIVSEDAARAHADHQATKPGFFARLFGTAAARAWKEREHRLHTASAQALETFTQASKNQRQRDHEHQRATLQRETAEREVTVKSERYSAAQRLVREASDRLGTHFVSDAFFSRPHDEKQKSTPWLDDATQRLRDDVFCAAIALHRAFIDAAAKPLRHNLGVLMNAFSSGRLPAEKQRYLADMWSSFFLVVPLVSTTFASLERMLGSLPPESLGWLLVDEAGQAIPQAAIGALMRTKRAVVVGDPIQIEPVVVLPDTLTQQICRRFGVSPDRFNAPESSVQTLADAATPYFAEFQGRYGSRIVGVPLLVHRRCSEPMFGISNAVAYERLMVQAKPPKGSAIRQALGDPAWINVEGDAVEKWCPQEGAIVVGMLRQLAAAGIEPDLYVVTPFVTVAENLRRVIRESGVLKAADSWRWTYDRVGTVHTVQGREAEAVIFVLGAPVPSQNGARGWAGGKPNLLNVAVTRAKETIYVVGNRRLWREAGLFRELDARLPNLNE